MEHLGLRDRNHHRSQHRDEHHSHHRENDERRPHNSEWHDLPLPDHSHDNMNSEREEQIMKELFNSEPVKDDKNKENELKDKNQMKSTGSDVKSDAPNERTEGKDANTNAGFAKMNNEPTSEPIRPNEPMRPIEPIESGHKAILLWTPSEDIAGIGKQPFIDSNCIINKCIITTDKSESTRNDAIVFDARHLTSGRLPDTKPHNQKWIFFSSESPLSVSAQALPIDSLTNRFDLSWTYRSDSDIVYSYANVRQIDGESSQSFKASDIFYIWKSKSKMILWLTNKCQTASKRETYVSELKDLIDVDIYSQCSDDHKDVNVEDETVLKNLAEKYLFVVAFEEDFCKDYVSKRLFKYLEHNMIPIVRGGADYSKIVPPNSVVDAKDFPSAKDLADYILDIGSDFQKFKKFYEWKRNYKISYERKDLCQLCYRLHDQDFKASPNRDLIKWWFDSTKC